MMTMRAHVQRDANAEASEDPFGGPDVPDWQTLHESLPCRTWFESERHVTDASKTVALEDRKVIVPKGTDVKPGDRILDVRDRRSVVVFSGPAKIEAAGNRKDHVELVLEEVS
jgi:hypothetical protein